MRNLHRNASRATFALVLSFTAAGAAAFAGCSDDEPTNPITSTTPDGSSPDATTPDGGGGGDGSADTSTPETAACPDVPVDCTKKAGNTVLDDGGPGNVDGGVQGEVPVELRCTQLYSCWSTKTVSADHRNYAPGFTLYSDGADKQRWVFLPAGTTIDTGGGDAGTPDEWIFPVGTAVYKEFKLGAKRIETRRIWKASANEWVYSVWRWSDDESTATLTYGGDLVPNTVHPGKMYEVPKTTACDNCHAGHKDKFLSLDAWSMGTPNATGVTLTQLKAENKLSSWAYPTQFAVPEDSTNLLGPAIGFYYNNCGFCHKPGRPGAGTGLRLHLPVAEALPISAGGDGGLPDGGAGLPFDQTPLYQTGVGQAHVGQQGVYPSADGFMRIVPGDAGTSVVYQRDLVRDPDGGIDPKQMPNVLTRTVDQAAITATKNWIEALD